MVAQQNARGFSLPTEGTNHVPKGTLSNSCNGLHQISTNGLTSPLRLLAGAS